MQTKEDIDQGKKKVVLHDENEVALFRLDIADNYVLQIYHALASHWWWEGLNIKAQVDKDLTNPNQYNLHQTDESGEYDPLKHPLKPRKLGYMVITRVDNDNRKPVDVKLVCCWMSVFSFWKEVESRLKIEYRVLEQTQTPADLIPNSSVLPLMQPTKSEKPKNIFRKKGNAWEICFQGCEIFLLSDMLGLSYIHYLLRNPNKEINVATLEMVNGGNMTTTSQGTDFDEVLNTDGDSIDRIMDKEYKETVIKRLHELKEDRSEAEARGDEDALIKIDDETESIKNSLASSSGLRGKSREMSSTEEKARQRVRKAIIKSYEKIEHDGKCPELKKYLMKNVSTGVTCEYKPPIQAENIDWILL